MLSLHIDSQIYTNFSFTPTLDQKKLIEMLSQYIAESKNGDIFIVNGYAGTGKTTVIAALVKTLRQHKTNVYLLAPTGRAAKIMSQYSSTQAYTIHKKIYKQKSALIDKFVLDRNLSKNSYFIIDEASMLSDSSYENNIFGSGNLLHDLISYVNNGANCRLIIVGDKAQLPPIGHPVSPALDIHTMEFYGRITYCEIKKVVRQQMGSGVLTNATLIRKLIERGEKGIPKFKLDYPDIKAISGSQFVEELETAYSLFGIKETIVITRSNKQANRFNQGIRSRVLYQEEEISSGDLLMVVKNNYHYISEEQAFDFIANGDIVEIMRIRRYEELYGFRFVNVALCFPDYDNLEMECKIILDTLESDTPSLNQEQSRQLFYAIEEDYSHITRKAERYNKIKEDDYYNALQIKFAYAITCHKAQGGQWDCVFIDKMLFGEEEMNSDLQRWLYTAFTRTKKKVYLINFDDRFFENPPEYW